MMEKHEVDDFLNRYGTCMTVNRASDITGISKEVLKAKARELGFVFSAETLVPRGLEHLPALPADARIRNWPGGTIYRIPTVNHPGILEVLIHNNSRPLEDDYEPKNRGHQHEHDDV